MAAKKCPDWIPLCHPGVGLTGVEVELHVVDSRAGSDAAGSEHQTGAEGHGTEVEEAGTAKRESGLHQGIGKFGGVRISATVECEGKTGVEMEALTAVVGAALSVVDMCKGVDRGCRIEGTRVVRKEGGRSGRWREVGYEGEGGGG